MKLSVVIVNYNVKYFLHQALASVYKSEVDFDFDVYVVDNASVDGSCEMIEIDFPQVKLIRNPDNLGFSKANNIAIRDSQAEYVLLLNPDTIIREDTLQQVVDFMDTHEDAGALGVKMFDGQGEFLPESKRGFPSPSTAFYKMSGLSSIFPKSKVFNQYHLGFLDSDEIHEVDVLSGAFMLLRQKTLKQVGLLDEDYFMYGEDIDLSYRIKKSGYKNYYFPHAPIIHFKGESTKKSSLNYVLVFYRAMIIFAEKHFQSKAGRWYVFLLNIAIYLRAGLAVLRRIISQFGKMLLDIIIIIGVYLGWSWVWVNWLKDTSDFHFLDTHYYVNLPVYVVTWLALNYLVGVYEKSAKLFHLWLGMAVGTIAVSTWYGFFPNEWRSSRGIILLTFLASSACMSLYRIALAWRKGELKHLLYSQPSLIIIGSYLESLRVVELLHEISVKRSYLGFITPNPKESGKPACLGEIQHSDDILKGLDVDEIIFSAKDISSLEIINQIASINKEINFKVASESSDVILGSHSKNSAGDLLTYDVGFNINKSHQRRLKRSVDVVVSLLFVVFSPLLIWIQLQKVQFLKNIFSVLINRKTWVSYKKSDTPISNLPPVNEGVLSPVDNLYIDKQEITQAFVDRQNYLYAKDYQVVLDLQTIFNSLNKLGGA